MQSHPIVNYLLTLVIDSLDFACPEEGCERRFGVRSNMLRHVRLVHRHLKHSSGEQLTQDEWETGEPGF